MKRAIVTGDKDRKTPRELESHKPRKKHKRFQDPFEFVRGKGGWK